MGNLGDLVLMKNSLERRGAKTEGLTNEQIFRLYFEVITELNLKMGDAAPWEF